MADESFKREIIVSKKPGAVYRALTKEIDKWWTISADVISEVGDQATFRFGSTYWTMNVQELIPEQLIVLECVEANHFHEGMPMSIREEWLGTKLIWEIAPHREGTKIAFVHQGLIPALECYDICQAGWEYFFVNSLKSYLETGVGQPWQDAVKNK
jgi:uncharacterized protein YndB with AHSA1/START domain